MPVFDQNGKKVREVVKDVVVKSEHDYHNNPNDGLVYTDFTVEALQRLGISLTPVNPAFVGDDLVGVDAQLNNVASMEQDFFNQQTT